MLTLEITMQKYTKYSVLKLKEKFYQVSCGSRRWTVLLDDSGWSICNESLLEINIESKLGKELISACKNYAEIH